MDKKMIFSVFLVFFMLSAVLSRADSVFIGVNPVCGTVNMTGYNASISDFSAEISNAGFVPALHPANSCWGISAEAGYIFNNDFAGKIAPFIFVDYISVISNDSEIFYTGKGLKEKWTATLNSYFIGLGLRKYIASREKEGFDVFFALKAGADIVANNSIEKMFYDSYGNLEKANIMDINGVFLGAAIETGYTYYTSENLGLNIKFGYRVCANDLSGVLRSTQSSENNSNQIFKMDLSGLYIGAGLTYIFEINQDKAEKPDQAADVPAKLAVKIYETAVPTQVITLEQQPTQVKTFQIEPTATQIQVAVYTPARTVTKKIPEKARTAVVTAPKAVDEKKTGNNAVVNLPVVEKKTANFTLEPIFKENSAKVIAPDELPPAEMIPKFKSIVDAGDIEFMAKNYKKAADYYEKAIKYGENAALYKRLGNCYYFAGDEKTSLKYYMMSLKINPLDKKLKDLMELLK